MTSKTPPPPSSPPILNNLDNFPTGAFYSQLCTKEYSVVPLCLWTTISPFENAHSSKSKIYINVKPSGYDLYGDKYVDRFSNQQ